MTLNITHLKAGYNKNAVLRDISAAELKRGAFVGLIGPNASGKSTLLKTLAGLVTPMSGKKIAREIRTPPTCCIPKKLSS